MKAKNRKPDPEQAERNRRRVEEVLRIRIDGAQAWDVAEYVREHECGDQAADPWKLADGEKPLSEAQIGRLIRQADRQILESVRGDLGQLVARQLVQRRTLFARAVNNGELSVALACLRDESNLLGLYNGAETPGRKLSDEGREGRVTRIVEAIEGPSTETGARSDDPGRAGAGGKPVELAGPADADGPDGIRKEEVAGRGPE